MVPPFFKLLCLEIIDSQEIEKKRLEVTFAWAATAGSDGACVRAGLCPPHRPGGLDPPPQPGAEPLWPRPPVCAAGWKVTAVAVCVASETALPCSTVPSGSTMVPRGPAALLRLLGNAPGLSDTSKGPVPVWGCECRCFCLNVGFHFLGSVPEIQLHFLPQLNINIQKVRFAALKGNSGRGWVGSLFCRRGRTLPASAAAPTPTPPSGSRIVLAAGARGRGTGILK